MISQLRLEFFSKRKELSPQKSTKDTKTNRIFLCLFAAALFLISSVFSATNAVLGQSLDETVATVEKHYEDLGDLTASVVQKNFLKSLDKTRTFEGTLLIKKPGRLRLDYNNGQTILIDGKAVLFYSKKSEQLIKKTFTDFEQVNIPVAFLLGAAHIRDDFNVLSPDPQKPGLLELTPKKTGAAMEKLLMSTEENGRINSITIHDRSGNVTEIIFSDVRENTGLRDKQFRFKPPAGTEIIEQ